MRGILKRLREQLLGRPFDSLCDAFFVFYALWTLVWIASYAANLSLSAIVPLFISVLALSLLALGLKACLTDQQTETDSRHARGDNWCVFGFTTVGVLLTLFLHRPDSDDELYLGMAYSLLANPSEPIQQLPGYEDLFYGIASYDPLKAMVSYTTGLPLLESYYLLAPSLMSGLTVIVTYRLLRALVPDGWLIGMLFFFIVMLAWGDVHRTLANFGFVRMFQGKSALVSMVVPALFLYWFLVRDKVQARYHSFLLAAALISGAGLSRGGWIIGPLVLAFLGLASVNFRALGKVSRIITIITGVSAAALLLAAYCSGWTLMNPSQLIYMGRAYVVSTTNQEVIEFTMGSGFRAIFLLTCVGGSFLFVRNEGLRYVYRNFIAIFFLLLLIPWSSDLFGKMIHELLGWRWVWVTPVPVFASVAVGGAVARVRQISSSVIAGAVFLVIALGFAASSPRLVLSDQNRTSLQWPDAKLNSNSVYLRPYGKVAAIKNGKLYLGGHEQGF